MSTLAQTDTTAANLPPALAADYRRWCAAQAEKRAAQQSAERTFGQVRDDLLKAFDLCPEHVEIPPYLTAEGERLARFRRVCDPEFSRKIERAKLTNAEAFDRVAQWDGSFPGPLAVGPTGASKTRAAWSAIGRLWVRENRPFAWFPAKRLVTEFERYESRDAADEFWRYYSAPRFRVLFVDDLDKLNWQFESQCAAIFQFYDWIYRGRIACLTTTNKDRAWWADKMGDPFTRRLFDEAHFEVRF